MDFDSVIKKRKSVRSFSKKRAHWKSVLDAIDAASQGPFAGNHHHLKFLIIEEEKTIRIISDVCEQPWISQASIVLLVCSDDTHLENIYGERGRVYSRQQAGAAIQTVLLKLVDLGLSACWVGAYSDDILKSRLSIPQNVQIEAVIPVGYSTDASPKKPKSQLEEVIFWESWEKTRRPSLFEEAKQEYRPE